MRLPLPQFSTADRPPSQIAEVIETSTTEFLAQCLEPDSLSFPVMPAFGSWVTAQDEETSNQIFAVVYHATTTPIDSVHRARALGLSLEELREQQPQIFAMLRTEFRAVIVGFRVPKSQNQLAGVYQHLPPRPPPVHQAVHLCDPGEVLEFTTDLAFLRTLLDMGGAPVEALVAAVIRHGYQLRDLDRNWLVQAGRSLSVLLKDDYDRLQIILKQVHP